MSWQPPRFLPGDVVRVDINGGQQVGGVSYHAVLIERSGAARWRAQVAWFLSVGPFDPTEQHGCHLLEVVTAHEREMMHIEGSEVM